MHGVNIFFRVDASDVIGTGHVMRCLALAHELRRRGAKAFFLCRELPNNLCDEVTKRGFQAIRLPMDISEEPRDCDGVLPYCSWLGTSWQTDLAQTRAALEPFRPVDWLVVDHYALDARWESALRPLTKHLMAIDDLFDRFHDVDLLLNQNILPGSSEGYAGLLPDSCRQLLGPRYALLQASYQETRSRMASRGRKIERVLVYFGGVDAVNLTARSLEALLAAGCGELDIDVVVPVAGPHAELIRVLAARLPGAHVHETLPSLAELMANADLAIGAAGTTSWERLCLGLPALVVTLSENQRIVAEALYMNELALWLGHHDEVTVAALADVLRRLLKQGLPMGLLERCSSVVDGRGAVRVANVLLSMPELSIRPAELIDATLIYDWRNDPSTRQFFFDPRPIDLEEHMVWYSKMLSDPDSILLIGKNRDKPIGAIRFDIVGDVADISIFLAPDKRGLGLGRRLIQRGGLWLKSQRPTVRILNAKIHPQNIASQTAFLAAGYRECASQYQLDLQ